MLAPPLERIAVAIPYKNIAFVLESLDYAINENVNFIEIRFDYNEKLKELTNLKESYENLNELEKNKLMEYIKVQVFPSEDIIKILEMRKRNNKLKFIFTLRKYDERGKFHIEESLRLEIIKYLLEFNPDYLDLESQIEKDILLNFNNLAKIMGVSLIFSYHNWINTPSKTEIKRIINDLIQKCPDLEPIEGKNNRNVLKLIFTAKKLSDNDVVLSICKEYSSKGLNVIIFCMGKEGIFSRIGCLNFGSYFSFASIYEETAPGQIHIKDFKNILLDKI